jgi:hypothetical protein
MRFLHDIAGIAGSELAILLAIGAAVLMLSGHGVSLDYVQFASGNF